MFDNVEIDVARLDLSDDERFDIGDNDWQTKSMENQLWLYSIAGDELFVTKYVSRPTSDVVVSELEPVKDFTGEINFYVSGDSRQWYEFNAEFKEGKLVSITRDESYGRLPSQGLLNTRERA